MSTLTLDLTEAKKLYPTASAQWKAKLEDAFGKTALIETDITDRVKSYEDACAIKGMVPRTLARYRLAFTDASEDEIEGEFAFHQLTVICEVLNEGWIGDYNNSEEKKHYPWFEWSDATSGFGFSFSFYVFTYSLTFVGSRLCFRTDKLAAFAGRTFLKIYNKVLIKQK